MLSNQGQFGLKCSNYKALLTIIQNSLDIHQVSVSASKTAYPKTKGWNKKYPHHESME
jgi:hypothetical protein